MIEPDIWTAANLLLKRHGDDASKVAYRRSKESATADDVEGAAIWRQIHEAVDELVRSRLTEGERVN